MTLIDLKIPKYISVWVIGIVMIVVPLQYFQNPNFGQSAMRISQAQIFEIMAIILFSIFILQNIYLSLFMLWSLFLYYFYGFPNPSGMIVLSILGALLIYEAVYRVVTKENFHILINFMIFFALINMAYMVMQEFGWELIYRDTDNILQHQLIGFMGIKAVMGMFFAMCLPFFCYKYPKISLGLFVPLYYSECSAAMVAGIFVYLFNLWFLSRKWFCIALIILSIGGTIYTIHDSHAGMFEDRFKLWKVALQDAVKKPIFGWGIDSFRCITNEKDFLYWKNVRTKESFRIDYRDTIESQHTHQYPKKYSQYIKEGDILDPWDNPHNEYLMLLYEFGIIGIVIFGFIAWDMWQSFNPRIEYLIPLAGFFIGLLVMSTGQFPFHLARIGLYIPIFLASYYKFSEKVI